jgi:predicted RNA-binding protein with PUA-like domain
MAYFLLKTEPSAYSFAELERDGSTRWDGVSNNAALKHMRSAGRGDEAIIYHTGEERAAVGMARLVSAPYADPVGGDPRLVVFDLVPIRRLPRPVTLAEIKADPAFAGFDLVRQPRLSVMPVPVVHWRRILALAGLTTAG